MQEFMIALIECSVTMSILVMVLITASSWLSKRYSAKWLYYSWLVIVLGFIIPFRYHPDIAFSRLNDAPTYVQKILTKDMVDMVNTTARMSQPSQKPWIIPWYQVCIYVWILGFLVALAYHGLMHYKFLKMIRRWGEQPDMQMNDTLQKIKTNMGINMPVELKICPFISSPMMIGFIKPTILLPRTDFSSYQLSFILKHELVHFKRKDLWYKSLVIFATVIHWFNPLIYVMAKTIASICEVSCDVEVISKTDIETRQQYSETIISVIQNHTRMQTAFSTNFYGGKSKMKTRILSIMDTRKKRAGVLILCIVVLGTLGTGVVYGSNKKMNSVPQTTVIQDSTSNEETVVKEPTKQELLSEYGPYGISFDKDGKMYFDNELVRYFWDGTKLDDNTAAVKYEYLNEQGTVDVHTIRKVIDNGDGSMDPMGDLTGIVKYSNEEFEHRNLEDLKGSANEATYVEVQSVSGGKTFSQIFSQYKDFGIEYKEQSGSGRGNVYYNGQLVNLFVDINSDGEVFTFQSMDKGEISVYTVYDEKGKLIGVNAK